MTYTIAESLQTADYSSVLPLQGTLWSNTLTIGTPGIRIAVSDSTSPYGYGIYSGATAIGDDTSQILDITILSGNTRWGSQGTIDLRGGSDHLQIYVGEGNEYALFSSRTDLGGGDDSVIIYGSASGAIINAGDGRDLLNIKGAYKSFFGGTVNLGSGNDEIYSRSRSGTWGLQNFESSYFRGDDGDDTFDILLGSGTVDGGGGVDKYRVDLIGLQVTTQETSADQNQTLLKLNDGNSIQVVRSSAPGDWAITHKGDTLTLNSIEQIIIDSIELNGNSSNQPPIGLTLSSSGIQENSAAGSVVGTLSATDPNTGSNFIYTLVAGNGINDANNSHVEIVGDQIKVKSGASIDYETNPLLNLNIQVTDNGGLTYTKAVTANVLNVNEAPTDVLLTSSGIPENSPARTIIGTLSATDPDASSTFTYALAAGNGSNDADNTLVEIVGNEVRVKPDTVIDYETNPVLNLNIQVTDNSGLSLAKAFETFVLDPIKSAPIIRSNSVYTLVDGPSWSEAEAKAMLLGGHLTTVDNQPENGFLRDTFLQGGSNLYIGFNDRGQEGIWQWANKSLSHFTEWRTQPDGGWAEPNNYWGNENVAMMYLDGSWNGYWNDINETGISGYGVSQVSSGIAEIPITSSINLPATIKEGAGIFTTTINLSAGTSTTGNLVNGTTVYWKLDGITGDDLETSSPNGLAGSGTIINGQLQIRHALKSDSDTGEQFRVSVYSNASMTSEYQIGTTQAANIAEKIDVQGVRGNSLYSFISPSSWSDAEQKANALGGHLATIDTQGENQFLLDNSSVGFFIGLNRKSGSWQWSSGSNSRFTNWRTQPEGGWAEPNNWLGIEDVVMVMVGGTFSGYWNDVPDDGTSVYGPYQGKGVAEIPITSSINLPTTIKEGHGVFTTTFNLSAGTTTTGNLVDGTTVYWKVHGITADDLDATSPNGLTGSGTILNGQLQIQHALKSDGIIENENFSVSMYSDAWLPDTSARPVATEWVSADWVGREP
jgi:hypothetical protein